MVALRGIRCGRVAWWKQWRGRTSRYSLWLGCVVEGVAWSHFEVFALAGLRGGGCGLSHFEVFALAALRGGGCGLSHFEVFALAALRGGGCGLSHFEVFALAALRCGAWGRGRWACRTSR